MKQLYDNNITSYPIVAINARDSQDPLNVKGYDTVIKFGGWDQSAVDGELTILETQPDDNGKTQFALNS